MIFFEVRFLKTDNIKAEFVYENLKLFIVSIVTVYVPQYYCFHDEFG